MAKRVSSLQLEKFSFFHEVVAVALDGAGADAYCGRDFFADFSGGEELDDFEFAVGV